MSELRYITKNGHTPHGKPKVYFTCHPEDFDRTFDMITKDIFKTHDCVIYYPDRGSEEMSEWEISSVNLIVVPVTYKLLTTPNRAMDSEIPFAIKSNIPVLPILIDTGLDELYSDADRFGDMQYLNKISSDNTEISYADKLKKHLDSVLIDDETVQRIRDAFDAYIFLSYRKIDRKYANELMGIIHDTPRFRDIAIWYDEFLVPGEDFRQNIERALNNSIMVALLVTPSLLKDSNGVPNFIVREEYPAAAKSGKDIIPAEMEPTDRRALEEKFDGISSCVDPRDAESFRQRLLESLARAAILPREDDPTHNFLIGLAYLNGIDVEINYPRAIELIGGAADAGNKAAVEKMIDIYITGQGVKIDNGIILKYRTKLTDITGEAYTSDPTDENLKEYISAFFELANSYFLINEYDTAYRYLEELIAFCKEHLNTGDYSTDQDGFILYHLMICQIVISNIEKNRRNFSHARELLESSISMGRELAWDFDYAWSARNMAVSYRFLSEMAKAEGDIVSAIEHGQKALEILENIERQEDNEQFSFDVAIALFNMSANYKLITDYDNIMLYSVKAHEKIKSLVDAGFEIYESWYPSFINNLAEAYRIRGDIEKAIELYKNAEQSLCDYYEKSGSHIVVQEAMCSFRLGQCYFQQGDCEKSIIYLQKSLQIYQNDPSVEDTFYENGEDIITVIHMLLGTSYSFIDEYEKAAYHYRISAQSADSYLKDDRITTNVPDYILSYSYYAQTLNDTGERELSMQYFKKAERLIKKHGIAPDNARMTACMLVMYFTLGGAYMEQEDGEAALKCFLKTEEMIELLEQQGPHFLNDDLRLAVPFNMAMVYADFDGEKAKEYALRAIELAEAYPENARNFVIWDILACCYYCMYCFSSFMSRRKWKKKCQYCIGVLSVDFPDEYDGTTIAGLLGG